MTNLYSRHEINTDETKNQDIKRVEVLFDLKGDSYAISDNDFCKNITCISGSCELLMEKDGEKDTIALNSPSVTIRLEKNTKAEIKNYTPDTKVVVEYLGKKIMSKKVSVIIPVYNVKPNYINDAVNSALAQTYKNIEIIIVNDGSTDEKTLEYLKTIDNPLIKIIHQQNQGLSEARNTGIKNAQGTYILPLDADDVIDKTYVEKACNAMESMSEVGIVYCMADFFGTKTGIWKLKDYSFPEIILGNCIFCTALFYKSDWEKVGGYKKEMCYGWEDYEFWLSLIENGAKVYKIPEILFHYRQHEISMLKSVDKEKSDFLWKNIRKFHKNLYEKYFQQTKNSFIENIFSIKHSLARTHKIITILWIKIKIKKEPGNRG